MAQQVGTTRMSNSKAAALPLAGHADLEARTIRQIVWRFMPLLMACYLTAYIDRVNVGFAALSANKDLGLSPSQYGWGAGLFFIGYCLAEFPSNLILVKVGARRWFARIMISMGLVAGATAFVVGPYSFYAARLLLGVAEAGLLPGVIWFFRGWVPQAYRAQYMAVFLLCIPLSSFLGSPISGAILGMDGLWGLKGWQWMFVLEGAPCVIFGLMLLVWLTETPAEARWLNQAQRDWLQMSYDAERSKRDVQIEHERTKTWLLLFDWRVLSYGMAFFGVLTGNYGLALWLPQMVKEFGGTNFQTGLVTAIPYAFGCVATILVARSSDHRHERVWHNVIPAFISGIGLGWAAFISSPALTMVAMSLAAVGIFGLRGTFFALISERFSDANAAAGIAVVGSYAALAGFIGPWVVGLLKSATGNFAAGMIFLSAMSFLGGIILLARNAYERRVLGLRTS
jgi:MFS transporter, ACS family, tartrate transporter